ncbi:PPOX class F420-dependent oxidoreductase [Streptomyces prunicolor]|uniref:PPOX class F420-dependent oxidoreductase n=1 Tax=Streptomyces prunicolor TaxID=67348 RepID=UPI0037142273
MGRSTHRPVRPGRSRRAARACSPPGGLQEQRSDRRDGQAVPTPVGGFVEDGTLYVLTPPETGKVKRMRNNPQVTIAPCDMKGTVPAGVPAVRATARLLDPAETARVQEMMRRRFFMYRLVRLFDRALGRERRLVAIAVTVVTVVEGCPT